jgi:hypothetical protein
MAEKDPVSLDALNGLLKERQRYEEWLTALEDKRASTSDAVYQRVHADYESRLREVSGKLAERAGELRETIDALTLRLEEISSQENQQREARQEAELRAAVGEYTDKQWKEIGGAWDKELTRLVKEKSTIDGQLSELNRIFALSVKEKQLEAAPSVRGAGGDGVSRAPISPVVPRPAVPELPTLNPPSRTEQTPITRLPTPTTTSPATRSPFDNFPVLRPATSTPPATTAVATPPSVPKSGGAHDPRAEQHKTLKCPECGAANYPTEWYCERCGGELATM